MTIVVRNQLTIACARIIRSTNLMLHFVQFQYTLIWVGIDLYSMVGKCLHLNCFPLISLIFYLLFESILQIIYRRLTLGFYVDDECICIKNKLINYNIILNYTSVTV